MGLFSKRSTRRSDEEDPPEATTVEPEGEPGVDRDWDRVVDGPFDVSERPDAQDRIDCGALSLPGVSMELRFDVEQDTRRVVGVTCGFGDSKVQIQVFAAPRSSGIWDDIRGEIVAAIKQAGGSVTEQQGIMGTELHTRLPSRTPSGDTVFQPARFVGIDGPKWFLRAVLHGPAAVEEQQARAMLGFVRQIIVDRGDEPRPPRELLALTAPKAAPAAGGLSPSDDPDGMASS
ncbi:MAG: DUF3710 domain-containing protein [Ornithinimicrobium sp.]